MWDGTVRSKVFVILAADQETKNIGYNSSRNATKFFVDDQEIGFARELLELPKVTKFYGIHNLGAYHSTVVNKIGHFWSVMFTEQIITAILCQTKLWLLTSQAQDHKFGAWRKR